MKFVFIIVTFKNILFCKENYKYYDQKNCFKSKILEKKKTNSNKSQIYKNIFLTIISFSQLHMSKKVGNFPILIHSKY